ncbi:MAG: response regulator transcription factor [Bacteroidales bacterium]|nr:response regulator transcription factor [Bacteroidales bacterium]
MNKISIGIFDEHKLVQEGIRLLLKDISDIEVNLTVSDTNTLLNTLANTPVKILIVSVHNFNIQIINLIDQLRIKFPNIKVLILSAHNDEEKILKSIKAGAKGFLTKDTDKNELVQAIYTLRNGFDYYSQSITHLLINKYIINLNTENKTYSEGLRSLSAREFEVLQLWGKSFTNKEIADKLFISIRTVESHKNHIMQKLNLKTTVDMVKFAIKNNIIEI